MYFEIKFEVEDKDLDYFRDVMSKARARADHQDEADILAKARALYQDVKDDVPSFVVQRLNKLQSLVDMVDDSEWKLPDEERSNVLSALSYFSDPEDLIPDHIPVLGFLDDAIMIELVVDELSSEIEAFEEFVAFRKREAAMHKSDEPVTREQWLDTKRQELQSRMRHRRRQRASGGKSRRSLFFR